MLESAEWRDGTLMPSQHRDTPSPLANHMQAKPGVGGASLGWSWCSASSWAAGCLSPSGGCWETHPAPPSTPMPPWFRRQAAPCSTRSSTASETRTSGGCCSRPAAPTDTQPARTSTTPSTCKLPNCPRVCQTYHWCVPKYTHSCSLTSHTHSHTSKQHERKFFCETERPKLSRLGAIFGGKTEHTVLYVLLSLFQYFAHWHKDTVKIRLLGHFKDETDRRVFSQSQCVDTRDPKAVYFLLTWCSKNTMFLFWDSILHMLSKALWAVPTICSCCTAFFWNQWIFYMDE